jgi:hypothetical protein
MDSEVHSIYRLIPRKFDFFEHLAIFVAALIGRFLATSWSVHGRIQHKGAGF